MLYDSILFIFILVSFCLIIAIIFNPVNNNAYYYSNHNNKFNFLNFIYDDSFVMFFTKVLVFIFFLLSIILSMFHIHKFIS